MTLWQEKGQGMEGHAGQGMGTVEPMLSLGSVLSQTCWLRSWRGARGGG